MLRITTTILVLCCFLNTTAHAIFGFGDEEKLPGQWNGPLGTYIVFKKDGTMENHDVLGFQTTYHWECSGGKLTTWRDDAGIVDKFRGVKVIKKSAETITFNGNDEMALQGQHYSRDKSK